jgi:hypothetical protein
MNRIIFSTALLMLLLISVFVKAQEVKTYTQTMDSLLVSIDKKQMKTSTLYDRVFPFANLTQQKDTTDFGYFRQAYSELYRASYNPTFKSSDEIYIEINKDQKELEIIPLGILDVSFDYLNEKNIEVKDDITTIKSTTDLFLQKQTTLIAPLKKWVASTSKIIYTLPSEYTVLENNRKIKHLEAIFDNGQNVVWIENGVKLTQNVEVNYETSGTKFIQFNITFDDETLVTQISNVDVRIYSVSSIQRGTIFPLEEDFIEDRAIVADIAFTGYDETSPSFGELEYRVYYNKRDNDDTKKAKIRKPIVILDGFDPGDTRKIYDGSIGYDFDKPGNSIYEIMEFKNEIDSTINLVELLRSKDLGYDVILVNFQEGADYIERNAMAVIALLERVNKELAINDSKEEVVMIGPSMGGLISRYALTYMEQNNMNHNTRLWISFDSPHLGANIPISIQQTLYYTGYTAGNESAEAKFRENFESPAARQMLIEQTTLGRRQINYLGGQNHTAPFRIQFMENLLGNGGTQFAGFPDKPRRIALVNGTTWGNNIHPAGLKYLDMEGWKSGFRVAELETRFLGNFNQTVRTMKIRITGNGRFFVGEYFAELDTRNINPNGSMDVVQGGTYNPQADIVTEFSLAMDTAGVNYEWVYEKNHSFIPTVSSLAVINGYKLDWSKPINRNLVCSNETPFDSYYSPDENEDHVGITAKSVEWLLKEIEGNPQSPRYTFTDDDFDFVSSLKTICVGTTASLAANGEECKFPSEIEWSVSPNLEIIRQDGFSVNVRALAEGEAYIKATFEGGSEYIKKFWVGEPQISPIVECGNKS